MPYGDNDWLALTTEETLEPELPICDAHHHFWDYRTDRVPYHRYLLHELAADINSGHNVRSTVFLEARAMYRQTGPEELRPVGEVEFVQGLAAASASGLYGPGQAAAAIVGHANLNLGDDVARVLDALQAASPNRFRGIRHNTSWDPHPEVESRSFDGQLQAADFRAGAQVLASRGLAYDNVVYFPQLAELADLARAVPDLTIVSNHIGGLMRVGPYANRDDEVMPAWRDGIANLAECPNVVMKLGGVGQPRYGFDWHLAGPAHRVGGTGGGDGAADELLHRAVRAGPLPLREQLPAGQGVVLVQRDVQRLQEDDGRVLTQRAGGHVPRQRGAGVRD